MMVEECVRILVGKHFSKPSSVRQIMKCGDDSKISLRGIVLKVAEEGKNEE
jgi:hypothetical protein